MLRQDQKSAGHIPESTHGQAVPTWKEESLFLLKGWWQQDFFSGELWVLHHGLALSEQLVLVLQLRNISIALKISLQPPIILK